MSYTIVYDRQVIITPLGYTVLLLMGDNNVYETNKKRARDWTVINLNQTRGEILDFHRKYCGGNNEHFMFRGKFLNDDEMMRFFENGIDKAMIIEEFCKHSFCTPRCSVIINDNTIPWGERGHTTETLLRASEELMTEKIVNNSEKFLTKLFDKLSEDKYLKLMPYRVGDFNRDYALRHSGDEFSNTVGFSLKNKIGNNILVLFDLSIFETRVEYYDIRAISHHYFISTFKDGNFVDKTFRDNVIITSSLIDEINEIGIELYKEYCKKELIA